MAELLTKHYTWLGYDANGYDSRYARFTTDTDWGWADLGKEPGTIGVLPSGAFDETYDDDQRYGHKKYREGKPGKLLRQLMTPDGLAAITESDVEDLANRIKAATTVDETGFALLRGEAIADAYHERDTPIDSCMVGKPTEWFALYAENPEVCGLLIHRDGRGRIDGRALVWETDQGTVMDRVYGSDAMHRAFANVATARGWMRGYYRDFTRPGEAKPISPHPDLTVRLANIRFAHYPYVDTFAYLDLDGSCLRNFWGRYDHALHSQYGDPNLLARCADCGTTIADEDDAYPGEDGRTYCDDCIGDHQCDWCNEWTGDGSLCDPCREEHQCADCGSLEEDLTMNANGDKGWCDRCLPNATCATCDAVEGDLTDGWCDDCAAKVCPNCCAEAPLITIYQHQTYRTYDRDVLWSHKRRAYCATRVTCRNCECDRLAGILDGLRATYVADQVAMGQASLSMAAD